MSTSTTEVGRPKLVTPGEWLTARKKHLAKEKEFTRLRDELSRDRRALPWEKVEKEYLFQGASGQVSLGDLFDGRSQLIVYHFMFGPGWKEGCPSCSYLADHFDGAAIHLAQRDLSFVVISRAMLPEIERYKQRMGWKFKWVSAFGSDFNHDYQVSESPEEKAKGEAYYNYEITKFPSDERPGASVFYKNEAGEVFHTYSTYGRGLDTFLGAYHFLDIAPKGRDEAGLKFSMAWVRRHDEYDGASVDPNADYVEPKKTDSCCD